eukprot:CAMPEP_0202906408 /NCGR_PEP_ID=MMETSP1392-20130828/38803_1 /ASSEMBLY_ACC=CAM_ASM_000868 /TAXON_ID=225041 /ORGANISM="Chlamydomonas chlamydogama, Strain SAG 11-48b" /LENGTH=158 /DNA_ID=CAMNT_0049594907 /DNA_START=80 /DNA_END=552 /DNA_ORIENTATION=+
MSQTFCPVCYNTSLTLYEGFLVCDACGTQSQALLEEAEAPEELPSGRFGLRRRADGPSNQPLLLNEGPTTEQLANTVRDTAQTYLKCLQALLQDQADALVTTFGAHQDLRAAIRHVWLSYIPFTGYLDLALDTMMTMAAQAAHTKVLDKVNGTDGDEG